MRVSYETVPSIKGFRHLMEARDEPHRFFCDSILKESNKSRVLEIGASGALNPFLTRIKDHVGRLDGLDPNPDVLHNESLASRFVGEFEKVELPDHAYDLAYSFNVVEHLKAARPFFTKLRKVLKPGGVFWAFTPHGYHPFCHLSKFIQWARSGVRWETQVNDYPSYYRLNTARAVIRATGGLGFASARFVHMPSTQWDTYFPGKLTWAAHLYDFLLGTRLPPSMLLLAYRLVADDKDRSH